MTGKFNIMPWGIRGRVLFLAVVPAITIALILGYYHTASRVAELRHGLEERGRLIVKHLAHASEFGLFSGNHELLQALAQGAAAQSDVQSVIIYDNNQTVLAQAHGAAGETSANPALLYAEAVFPSEIQVFDIAEHAGAPVATPERLGQISVYLSPTATLARQHEIIIHSLLIAFAGLLLGIGLAFRIGRDITTPIVRLATSMKRLHEGDFGVRVAQKSQGELAVLEGGFNAMADTIEKSHQALEREIGRATETLWATVKELEKKNLELDGARAEALAASQVKADFLAKMSHEIRTPINAVIGYTRLLEKTAQTQDQRDYTRTISRAAAQLLCVIDDILSLSKLEAGTVALEYIQFDLCQCCEDVIAMQRPAAHEKGLDLILLLDSDVPSALIGDPARTTQVLMNLVNNAVKFTAAGSVVVRVEVATQSAVAARLTIRVIDTGIGLSTAERELLFTAFTQADRSINRRFGGTGLGLAISKRLVEAMGGDIGVVSEPGQGAEFWFTLPFGVQARERDEAVFHLLYGNTVLLYDAHAISRRALRNTFLGWRMEVYTTNERRRLNEMLRGDNTGQRQFDVVVLSLGSEQCPIASELLCELRDHYAGAVVVLTSCNEREAHGLAGDGVAVVATPARQETLYRSLCRLLGREHAGAGAGTTATAPPPQFSGVRVLLAEDNSFNRILIARLLRELGIEVSEAQDGEQALALATQHPFDLVLMDVHMPLLDGIAATRRLRQSEQEGTRLPVVALTADVFAQDHADFRDAGIDAWALKPIDEDTLVQILRRWVQPRTPPAESAAEVDAATAPPFRAGATLRIPPQLLRRLVDELPAYAQHLRDAIMTRDRGALVDQAHQLHGVAGYFGLAELVTATGRLEHDSRALPLEQLGGAVNIVAGLLEDVVQQYRRTPPEH